MKRKEKRTKKLTFYLLIGLCCSEICFSSFSSSIIQFLDSEFWNLDSRILVPVPDSSFRVALLIVFWWITDQYYWSNMSFLSTGHKYNPLGFINLSLVSLSKYNMWTLILIINIICGDFCFLVSSEIEQANHSEFSALENTD